MTDRTALTGALDDLHARIIGALSRLAAGARDDLGRGDTATARAETLTTAHGAVDTLTAHLAARARDDLGGAVLSGQSYEPRLSGTRAVPVDPDDETAGTVTLTAADRAVDRLHPTLKVIEHPDGTVQQVRTLQGHAIDSPTFAAVVRTFGHVADLLDRQTTTGYQDVIDTMQAAGRRLVDLHQRITPTGARCASTAHDADGHRVQCERIAIGGPHCAKCWPHVRGGFPPPADLLRDWNSRLDRDCNCTSTVCIAADAHMPGACTTRIAAGEPKRTCDTCTKRKYRARRHEKAARGGPVTPEPEPSPAGRVHRSGGAARSTATASPARGASKRPPTRRRPASQGAGMTPEQFVREHRAGRMSVDRARWLMDQHPELREWWRDLCATVSKLAKRCDAIIEDWGHDLADEAEQIANRGA